MTWLIFLSGMLLGAFLGVLAASLCHIASRSQECEGESRFASLEPTAPHLRLVKGYTPDPESTLAILCDKKQGDSAHQVA